MREAHFSHNTLPTGERRRREQAITMEIGHILSKEGSCRVDINNGTQPETCHSHSPHRSLLERSLFFFLCSSAGAESPATAAAQPLLGACTQSSRRDMRK